VLLQLCVTTWKLFETLLCKRQRHVVYNLILRNLASHAHVDLSLAGRRSTTLCDVETNCVDDDDDDDTRTVTVNTDYVANSSLVTSSSSISASQTLYSDTLASGDSGIHAVNMNNIHSPYVSDNVGNASEHGLSRGDKLAPSAETDEACVADSAAAGDVESCRDAAAKCQSVLSTEAAVIPASSQALTESSDVAIQQVVYT